MTEQEISRELRKKWPSEQPSAQRRKHLRRRHAHHLDEEIKRTVEKLWILCGLRAERITGLKR